MSNLEEVPTETVCSPSVRVRSDVEVIVPREVPLGGPRAMTVRRTLPSRERTLVGAWCFADHFGPEDVAVSGGMNVPPHPHTGLQTVSWLFSGEIEHRDSTGAHAMVRPGELNIMTAGSGIAHSEVSTPATTVLHGAQLWVALPNESRNTAATFDHYVPKSVDQGTATVRVFLGSLSGETSPVSTFTPLLGAEIVLAPGSEETFTVDTTFEHGVLVDAGDILVDGTPIQHATMGYLAPGARTIRIRNRGDNSARVLLLGGTPFGEQVIMWWNFMGRTHDEIVEYREQWNAEVDHERPASTFGAVEGYDGPWLHAPTMPTSRLKTRG
ncbi:pirin family protein [Actinomycetes bacterium M1A6_2h]